MQIQKISINKEALKRAMQDKEIYTIHELARRAGVNYNTLRVMLAKPFVYTNVDSLKRVAAVLGTDQWIEVHLFESKIVKKGLE